MTGYGRAKKTLSNRDITVEVRSVNNRYLDCTVKLPRAYIFAEDAIKGRVQKAISRGKVDVFVTIDSTGADEEVVVVNEGLARSYLEALRKLYEIDGGNYLQKQSYAADLARIPDVLTVTKAVRSSVGNQERFARHVTLSGLVCPEPVPVRIESASKRRLSL